MSEEKNYECLEILVNDLIAHVTISRPKALNALNSQVLDELTHFCETVSTDTRVIVLRGAGDKAFVAGADIAAMSKMNLDEAKSFAKKGQGLTRRMEALDQVIIACVDGFALGGGCEIALACDIILATEKAKFGQPEVHLGLIPGFGGTQRLIRRIGHSQAMDMLLSGRHITGTQAFQQGLVSRCFEDLEALNQDLAKLTKGILKGGPKAVAMTKKLTRFAWDHGLDEGLQEEAQNFSICFENGEAAEGMTAFLEKRSANFT